ncbi:MAG: bifunctional adenosylcobinamide kinase/adenosylcobinamide-phosphate guanylyltransferase [Candidatus Rokuibacteriota bacterium]
MVSSLLVLGGARSGKSRFAVASQPPHGRVTFVATAQAGDGDMAARIRRHRAERPPAWRTVEEPFDLVVSLTAIARGPDAIVVDCLTVWAANRMLRGDRDEVILAEADALAELMRRRPCTLTIVSNEVGEGVHPESRDGLRFRDLLGVVNQRVAAAADRVVLMVAGLPLDVKVPLRESPIPTIQAG